MDDVMRTIESRHSIRRYTSEPVSDETLNKLLSADCKVCYRGLPVRHREKTHARGRLQSFGNGKRFCSWGL